MSKHKNRAVSKIFVFLFFFILSIIIISVILLTVFNYFKYSKINESTDYKVFVKSNVINILNEEYNQKLEKMYCVDGEVDDEKRIITINEIVSVLLLEQEKGYAVTLERYACKGYIGQIHTHPKLFGFMPICYFSDVDIYTWGELSGKNGHRVSGVYCNTDKISFYLSGSEYDGTIILQNQRIGYTLIA